jgi:hypothetical protein
MDAWANQLAAGEMSLDQVQQLRLLLSARPLLPAIILQSTVGARGSSGRRWLPGHARLGPSLLIEDEPGAAAAICGVAMSSTSLDPGVPRGSGHAGANSTTPYDGEAQSDEISLVALGGVSGGGGNLKAAGGGRTGRDRGVNKSERLAASLAPPRDVALQDLLQALGVPLLSQRVQRQVELPQGTQGPRGAAEGEGEHADVCRRARAVFPLAQRFIVQVRSPKRMKSTSLFCNSAYKPI